MFELQQVSKFYRSGSAPEIRALVEISLLVSGGAFAVLAGPSGSGKSTLLSLLGALERPTRGSVRFDNRDFAACSDVELARLRRRIGIVFQDFALLPGLPVWENVSYALIPCGVARAERYRRAAEILDRFGLSKKLSSKPRELSGGEQQRVAIARSLIGRPEVLLADEPTSNLDEEAVQAVIELLQQSHLEGTTIIASSHDPRLVAIATCVIGLRSGRLLP